MNIDLKGRWHGEYIYGSSYGPELEGCKGEFVMYVHEVNPKGFSGKVIETEDDEFHEATLEGFLHNEFINFIKRFEQLRYRDENQNVVIDTIVGYEVIYQGNYSAKDQIFHGDWEIRYDLTPLATEQGLEEFWTGTWWMKKMND